MLRDVRPVFEQSIMRMHMPCTVADSHHPVDGIGRQMEATGPVRHRHVERRCRGAFFLATVHVKVFVIGALAEQAVDRPRMAVEREDDGPVGGKDRIECRVLQPVRMC